MAECNRIPPLIFLDSEIGMQMMKIADFHLNPQGILSQIKLIRLFLFDF